MTTNKPVRPKVYPVLMSDKLLPFVGGAVVKQAFIACGLRDVGYRVFIACFDFRQVDDMEIEGIRMHKIHQKSRRIPMDRVMAERVG